MIELLITVTVVLLLLMLATALAPSAACNRLVKPLRSTVPALLAIQCGLDFATLFGYVAAGSELTYHLSWFGESIPFSVHYDSISGLMLALVSFVGLVVARYSVRYLDGDEAQGNYFRWTAVTVGAVSLLVLSGNLLMFFAAWVATSYGLHHLLLHYRDRPGAARAAWTKFVISRLGDTFLVTAIALVYVEFGTFDFAELFALAESTNSQGVQPSMAAVGIGWFLMLGAVAKSAQFPLHSWLPETLETPTPVSALMHAGVVNAGGYLVIRLSSLIVAAPSALVALTIIGAITAAFASVVMLTQNSIKKKLAYSTVAQMGFMMIQCGLGAFSAAMLHIIAHSLYKAHAFLNSGSVLTEARATAVADSQTAKTKLGIVPLFVGAGLTGAICFAVAFFADLDLASKPGGIALSAVFCFALLSGLWEVMATGKLKLSALSSITAAVLAGLYIGSYSIVNSLVASHVPGSLPGGLNGGLTTAIVLLAFTLLIGLQLSLRLRNRSEWLNVAYVHALNGFYIDAALRRTFSRSASHR